MKLRYLLALLALTTAAFTRGADLISPPHHCRCPVRHAKGTALRGEIDGLYLARIAARQAGPGDQRVITLNPKALEVARASTPSASRKVPARFTASRLSSRTISTRSIYRRPAVPSCSPARSRPTTRGWQKNFGPPA